MHLDKIYELGVFVTFFFYFLSFARLNTVTIVAREQSKAESDFFPNIARPGLYFNSWRSLEPPFVGCSAACRCRGYLSVHFQLQCEMKQVQETPGRL